jgi:hypothetical protein
MLKLISSIGFFFLAVTQSVSAKGVAEPTGDFFPEYIIHSCHNIPPDGYLVTEYQYISVGSKCQYKWNYVFESHFDKPLGHEMAVCQQGGLPAGWFKIADIASYRCVTTPPNQIPKPATAWIIKKFS